MKGMTMPKRFSSAMKKAMIFSCPSRKSAPSSAVSKRKSEVPTRKSKQIFDMYQFWWYVQV